MNKKKLRYAYAVVMGIASEAKCESLHHGKGLRHDTSSICPVEYEIQQQVEIVRQHFKDSLDET